MSISHAFERVLALLLTASLAACSGGGGGGGGGSSSNASPTNLNNAESMADPALPGNVQVASIELAQNLLQDYRQAQLMEGKDTLVKINLTADTAPASKPIVKLRLLNSAGALERDLDTLAPTVALPKSVAATPQLTQAYTVKIPSEWLVPDLRLKVVIDGKEMNKVYQPTVDAGKSVKIVLVNYVVNGLVETTGFSVNYANELGVASISAAEIANLKSYVLSRFPLKDIVVEVRSASFPFSDDSRLDVDPTSQALTKLKALQLLEAQGSPSVMYLGLAPKLNSATQGIASRPGVASMIFYPTDQKQLNYQNRVIVHELGHNFSLMHVAGCNSTAKNTDPQYPYVDGYLGGSTWVYNMQTGTLVNPGANRDVMTYCGGAYLSDYSNNKFRSYIKNLDLTAAFPPSVSDDMQVQESLGEGVLISGYIQGGNWVFEPFVAYDGKLPALKKTGEYLLRLTSARGVQDYYFDADAVEHATDDAKSFMLTIPNSGSISQVAVLKNGKTIYAKTNASQARVLAGKSQAASVYAAAASVKVVEDGGDVLAQWDAQTYPYMTLTHKGATKTVLAFNAQGGTLRLPKAQVPAGGVLEFALSDGMNTERYYIQR